MIIFRFLFSQKGHNTRHYARFSGGLIFQQLGPPSAIKTLCLSIICKISKNQGGDLKKMAKIWPILAYVGPTTAAKLAKMCENFILGPILINFWPKTYFSKIGFSWKKKTGCKTKTEKSTRGKSLECLAHKISRFSKGFLPKA